MELREHCRRGNGKAEVPEDQEITMKLCLLVSSEVLPVNLSNMIDQTWAEKYDINEHANLSGEKPIKPKVYTKNYRQLGGTRSERDGLPQIRTHQLDCPMPNSHLWNRIYKWHMD